MDPYFILSLINPNYKRSLICAAIADSGDEEWDFALERYLSTDLSSEDKCFLIYFKMIIFTQFIQQARKNCFFMPSAAQRVSKR